MSWEKYITLNSSDDVDLMVQEAVVFESPALKDYIYENNLSEDEGIQVPVDSRTLGMVMKYCNVLALHRCKGILAMSHEELRRVGSEHVECDALRVFYFIHAAHKLKLKSLMDVACEAYANLIALKGVEEIDRLFAEDELEKRLQLEGMGVMPISAKPHERSIHGDKSEV